MRNLLLRVQSDTAFAELVRADPETAAADYVLTGQELAERLAQGLQAGTLYIPAARVRQTVSDLELLQDIYDPKHLENVTGPS